MELRCKSFAYYYDTGYLTFRCELDDNRAFVYSVERQADDWLANVAEEKGLLANTISSSRGRNIEEALQRVYRGTVSYKRNPLILRIDGYFVGGVIDE